MTSKLGQARPEDYLAELDGKIQATRAEFKGLIGGCDFEVFSSSPSHFRMRAEFRIWHEDGIASYAMYEPGQYKKPVIIEKFTIGSQAICEAMPQLLEEINLDKMLRERLFQVEFLSSLSGELVITLIYHKTLEQSWEESAKALEPKLSAKIIGRSRKQKCVLSEDYLTEIFDLDTGKTSYQQIETGFTQPNAHVCVKMLNWSVEHTKHFGGDLLELYCGNGNFTIPLSNNFRKVLATEISKLSTRSALENIKQNHRENITLVRLSAEEVCEALVGVRPFRRLSNVDLDAYQFTTIFVDPPRAGLDENTLSLVSRFDNVVYISCNCATLKENLDKLAVSHQVTKFALFDQFPYTEHRECGVILKKRETN